MQRIMGIFFHCTATTRLLASKSLDEEEGESPSYPKLQNHHKSSQDSTLLKMVVLLCSSIYKAAKGLLQKLCSILFTCLRPRKTADPLLPIQNPPSTPLVCSSSNSHSILENSFESATVTHEEEDSFERNEIDGELLVSGTEIGCSNAVISEEIVEEVSEEEKEQEERLKHYCTDDEEGRPHIPCGQESPEENFLAPNIRGSNALTSGSHHEIVEEIAQENPPCLEEEEEVKVEVKVKSSTVVEEEEERTIKHYSSRHKILLVGEGDFSFSASLAAAFGSAANIVATSLDSKSFLKKNYGKALSNICELERRGATVMHGIDATQIANHESLRQLKFDRIIYNFPFAGFFTNLSTAAQLRLHRRLVSLFLRNAKQMMSENGEIHISHKTNGNFHAQFKVESIASSRGLRLIEAVRFERFDYPGYNTKYGVGGDDNFNCVPSNTFKFAL